MTQFISYSIDSSEIFDNDGEVIGTEEFWLIEKIYVPSELRGNGIARKMMTKALVEMKTENAELSVKLWCEAQDDDTDQELLAAFYESFGFEATGNGAEMEMSF